MRGKGHWRCCKTALQTSLTARPLTSKAPSARSTLAMRSDSAAAAAAGEQLQESDCDVLGQQKRGGCGGCTGCPGFRILFR